MSAALFSNLLVIDCASFIAGPAAATVLSDFGARVIKIEPPGLGDGYRNLIRMRAKPGTVDYFWLADSRNKESLAIDLKAPAARAVLDVLIKKADVFITNYPLPVRERLGLRAEDVTPLNSRLVYASLTPYGERGPQKDRTGYDSTAWWARSGLMDMVRATGETEPGISAPGMGDHATALAAFGAIVSALYRRQLTGQGGVVSASLLASGLWSNACQVQAALCGLELAPRGERSERNALYDTYKTADGRTIVLAVVNPVREWPLLVRAIEREAWLDEPLFATTESLVASAPMLSPMLAEVFAERTWAEWDRRLGAAGVTYGVVSHIREHADDPQIEANGLLPQFVDGLGLRTVDSPFHIEGETKTRPRMAPDVGQHTRAILEECGCDPAQIEALMGKGIKDDAG